MRLRFLWLFPAVLLVGLSFAAVREELHWQWATFRHDGAGYASYLAAWPDGRRTEPARRALEERGWENASAAHTPEAFERYLKAHPGGDYALQARDRIEELHWKAAAAQDTIVSYRTYDAAYPKSRFAHQAESRQAALRRDDTPFTRAVTAGSTEAIQTFLTEFPGHVREAEARAALRDSQGRDIVDLLRERKIEAEPRGSGIQTVSLRVRRLTPGVVSVRIPVGTFFVARNSSSQNMVTTAEKVERLASDGWVTLSVSAACANRPRGIPGADDSFTIQRSPKQAELARLMPLLSASGAPYSVQQAAVWIVTDDASYSALGVLTRGWSSRVIREDDAARAMQIYDRAGMDIRRKAIWHDRQEILSGLPDGDLKRWLRSKG